MESGALSGGDLGELSGIELGVLSGVELKVLLTFEAGLDKKVELNRRLICFDFVLTDQIRRSYDLDWFKEIYCLTSSLTKGYNCLQLRANR